MQSETRIYRPNQQVGWRWSVWREMVDEIVQSRELIWQLFLRDFKARYKQSALGVLWAIIMPLAMVGTFVFLNRSGVLSVGDTGVPYPVYALLGLTVWQLFATGLVAASDSIVSGGRVIVKINLPKETLVIASLGQALFEFVVRLALLIIICLIYRVVPRWTVIFFPLSLLPLGLLTLGLGLLLSLLNALLRDIAHMVSLMTTFLMLLTPVLYPGTDSALLEAVARYNPLAGLVTAARDVVIVGYLTRPAQFAWASGLSVLIFLVAWRLFHMAEPRMTERV